MANQAKLYCEKHKVARTKRRGESGYFCRLCHRGYKKAYRERNATRYREQERGQRARRQDRLAKERESLADLRALVAEVGEVKARVDKLRAEVDELRAQP